MSSPKEGTNMRTLILVFATVLGLLAGSAHAEDLTALPSPSGEYKAPTVGAVYSYRRPSGLITEQTVISVSGMMTTWKLPLSGVNEKYGDMIWHYVIGGNHAGQIFDFKQSEVAPLWPLKVGNAVKFGATYGSGVSTNTIRVVGYEKVTVPAGTFDAFVVQWNEDVVHMDWHGIYRYWITPEIGVVKLDGNSPDGHNLAELFSVKLPKP